MSQNVTNVTFYQDGNKVVITYDLDKAADVSVYMSTDGGNSFGRALQHVTGDVGKNVQAGTKNRIEYDALADFEKLQGDDFVFKVKAISCFDRDNFFLTVNAELWTMPDWAIGFRLGTMKKLGWYIGFLSNFNFQKDYSDFTTGRIYELNGETSSSFIKGTIGMSIRPGEVVSAHFGAGVGYRKFNVNTNSGWYRYKRYTYIGPAFEAGVMFHIKNFVLSADVTGLYNANKVCENRFVVGGDLGVGFCLSVGK